MHRRLSRRGKATARGTLVFTRVGLRLADLANLRDLVQGRGM